MTSYETSTSLGHAHIEIRGLCKSFGSRLVLEDINMRVEPGTILGFLGANGSGKTTTLRCLLGLAKADSGDALISGMRYRDLPTPSQTVGALCENAGLQPRLTAHQHLVLELSANGFQGDYSARIQELLNLVDLGSSSQKKVKNMSTGMRQRLGLALALTGDPNILILDEPANGLDPEGIGWLRGFITNFAQRGGCVLITSHQLAELQRSITHLAVLANGQIVLNGALSDFTDSGDLEQLYLTTIRKSFSPQEKYREN